MVVGSTIKISFSELTASEMERLEKRLTFVTPDGLVVTCFRKIMRGGYYRLPRGAWSLLPSRVEYYDRRSKPKMPQLNFTVELDDIKRDPRFKDQSRAVEIALQEEQGQIIRPPGTGKTQIALAFAAQCETRSLVLVHTEDILQQWIEYTQNAIPELEGKVGIIRANEIQVGHITIATVQTLRNFISQKPKMWWRQFGALIVDEAHHTAAGTWEALLNTCPAYYRLGFTASPTRADGMHPAITALIGPVIHRQKFSSPVKLRVQPVKTQFYFRYRGHADWMPLVRTLVADTNRNRLIARKVDAEIAKGNSVLVLSRRIEQLERIAGLMRHDGEILTGSRTKRDRKRLLAQFRNGDTNCILATQLADEALDVPRLNRIFLVHPGKHEGRIIQQIGRAIRQHPEKQDAVIYDVVDRKVRPLARQWSQRKRTYRKNGIKIRKRRLQWK